MLKTPNLSTDSATHQAKMNMADTVTDVQDRKPLKRRKLVPAEQGADAVQGAAAEQGAAARAEVKVSSTCLLEFKRLANLDTSKELGALLCMNRLNNIIDKLIIPKQEATSFSWKNTDPNLPDFGDGYEPVEHGQIHSHVGPFTCFMSKTDIENQYFTERNQNVKAIMIIYSQNCGNQSANVEGNLGMVQLDQGPPNHDGFKAYTLNPRITKMEKEEFEYFLKNEYDEQQYQQVYQPARWRVVYMGGTVVDLRQAMEIDGGQFPRAMKKVLRELAMN